jgi:hypothetical protein
MRRNSRRVCPIKLGLSKGAKKPGLGAVWEGSVNDEKVCRGGYPEAELGLMRGAAVLFGKF